MVSLSFLLLVLATMQLVSAHTLFSRLFIDGQDQGNATCIRMPHDPATAVDPIASLSSSDMACGRNGTTGVSRTCAASSDSTLTFEYRIWPDDAAKGSIDPSHKGPCAVYLKKVDSAILDSAAGGGWFKIWEDGYDEASDTWCTERLIPNNGHLSIKLPDGLEGGDYLVRLELLALQQADKTPSDPQFYIGCAQIFLQSTGFAAPDTTVSIPGYVAEGQAPLTFNIYTNPLGLPYPIPGPAISPLVHQDANSGLVAAPASQSTGLRPALCVLENANWCGVELDRYSSEAGCWNASANCWDQCTACFAAAPPTGSINCPIWEAKCAAIQQNCNVGIFEGPPAYMSILTPPFETCSLPVPEPASMGVGSRSASAAASAGAMSLTSTAIASAVATPTPIPSTAGFKVSTNGSCGGSGGVDGKAPAVTCLGSAFGDCCSAHGYCGSAAEYCSGGCQASFGKCDSAGLAVKRTHRHGGRHGALFLG